jgi:hypothetical protein
MRNFLSTHWKSIVALIILVLLAVFTMTPGAATPSLASRLRAHVHAIAVAEQGEARPAELERAAQHIRSALAAAGYQVRSQQFEADGQKLRNIEVSLSNVAPGCKPERVFIVGTHYDPAPAPPGANDNGSGTAAVLELARLLKGLLPAGGTELKFVFLVNEDPPWFLDGEMESMQQSSPSAQGKPVAVPAGWSTRKIQLRHLPRGGYAGSYPDTGNFIAFMGTRESSELVRQALAAFRSGADFPAEGLAAPSYVEGVTLSSRTSLRRDGYPALMITDTAFMRYPYFHTGQDGEDKLDYEGIARVVNGLARTIAALAGGTRT